MKTLIDLVGTVLLGFVLMVIGAIIGGEMSDYTTTTINVSDDRTSAGVLLPKERKEVWVWERSWRGERVFLAVRCRTAWQRYDSHEDIDHRDLWSYAKKEEEK